MKGLIDAELFKLRKRRMSWILLALTAGVISVLYALLFLVAPTSSATDGSGLTGLEASLRFENAVAFGDSTVFRVVAILAIVLAGTTTASEFGWRTIVPLVTWTGSRRRIAVARIAAMGAAVAVAVATGYLTVLAASAIGNAIAGSFDGASGTLVVDALAAASRTWMIVMVYAVLATALALLTRSTAAAIAIPLLVLLLEPFGVAGLEALGGPAANLANFTLAHNIDGLLAADGTVRGANQELGDYPSAYRGALALVLFMGFTGWLAISSFARRDIRE